MEPVWGTADGITWKYWFNSSVLEQARAWTLQQQLIENQARARSVQQAAAQLIDPPAPHKSSSVASLLKLVAIGVVVAATAANKRETETPVSTNATRPKPKGR